MSLSSVRNYFKQYNMDTRIVEFPVSSATVELAAQAIGCKEQEIAKTMSFHVGLNCKMKLELRNWDKGACPFIPIRAAAGPLFSIFL